ncbi:MAG TPA: glycosyltransferase family 4 protein [Roseiflexaceae bacterium]|nr:glycosyltransferase family 4 protein [Roseiflexaceae bacterium]
MRILHLAYEDPAQPGSGGGSVRTREINRRLAARHQITCVVAGYPGAQPRVEDGVAWVPIGLRQNITVGRLAYFTLLRAAVTRHPHDLVIEDFGAPFSVGGAPLFTKRPVVASVQWLFAAEMRTKYGLPFDWFERAGLPFYNRFIAVSDWLGRALQSRCPEASVEVLPNGVEQRAFDIGLEAPRHLLFVGRLDCAQKGADLLLHIMARAAAVLGDALPPLLIAGDGPDRDKLVELAKQLGIERRVVFCGRVEGEEKYRLMAQAYAVLMPSRFETFGMVAVEAQACGAPLIAFDIGPLSEVTGGGSTLVAPFDEEEFAQAVVRCVRNAAALLPRRLSGRRWARRYSWDDIAARQERCYLDAVSAPQRQTRGLA